MRCELPTLDAFLGSRKTKKAKSLRLPNEGELSGLPTLITVTAEAVCL
ncbi:hypothetical protein HMPREF9541_03389 [Escherichia coli MS 116-1]|nr:hypothetical protein HMPREF9541_03389 [Escherichia coli MS 116-1]